MNTKRICQHCGQPLGPEAVEGLCPACLMKMGLGLGTEATGGAVPGKRAFTPPAPAALAELFPQFEILAFIGQGGMGAVYKARQKQLDRIVALKILPPGIGEDPAFAERFAREARAMAKLNHPGIVTIYDFGQAQGRAGEPPAQLYYFIMEFVDGVSLRQLLQTGRVEPREALAIVPQICDALQYAHDHGLVHRDIKPENILLDRQGHVKVADFGLAKLVGTEALTPSHPLGQGGAPAPGEETVALTDAGKLMGTPQYMAPEQVEHPGAVDHRADIYALGVVFYQMLTGELPGKRIEPPSKKVLIDVRLDEVVLRALERNPERRYDQASALKTQVETIASSTAEVEPTLRKPELQPPSFPWRKTVVWHAAGLLGLIGLLLLVKLLIDRYAVPLNEGRQLPAITRLFCGLGAISAHWWFLVIPAVLGLDVLLCWFASRLAGRRGLVAWSVLLTLTLVFASAYAVIASVLPLEEMLRQRRASRPAFGQVNAGAGTAENGRTLSSRAKPAEIAGDEPAASSLQFRWVAAEGDTTSPADLFEAPGPTPGRYVKVRVLKELLLDGSAVARAGWDTAHDQRQQVMLELTPAGRQQFAALTAANINRQLAIIFEGRLLSTPVIRSAINSAEVPLPIEHDDLDHLLLALNRVSAKPDVPTLTPPTEVVMPQARESTNLVFLNLATQRWTTNELPFRPDSRESYDWLRRADVDISGGFDDRYVLARVRERLQEQIQTPATNEVPVHPIIRGYDLVVAPASSNSWQTATPAQIRFQWDLMTREPKSETHLGSAPGKLDTFYVRTRDNAFGLLQVLGFSDNPRGVRIRYKLVDVIK